MIVRTK
ncbi:unnamed protein product [Cuscuta europaea]|nr:unnamed protein product [Cuscuta europaea]